MKKRTRRWPWVLLILALATALGATNAGWFQSAEAETLSGAPVRRGPLRISVVQRGNLEAKDSTKITSELEGQTTILKLVPEGTLVQEGDLLAVLDDSDERDRRASQEISVNNSEADYTKAVQQYEIQKSQNDSDIAAAKQRVEFAETDQVKYLEGDWPQTQQEADESIALAEEDLANAEETLRWSKDLAEKGFLTRTELERDTFAANRATIALEQAKRRKGLLIQYDHPRETARLQADLEEAKRELDRTELQARARLVDFEAAMRTSKARLQLESEQLAKIERQIANATILSPAAGMVVYARESGRRGSSDPMAEGRTVREREEIITIPRAGGMVAEASIHETVLKQVRPGQSCMLQVDAIPGFEFAGRVDFVAPLPDTNSWWANPNQRQYKTEVSLTEVAPEMRPGMSCSIEILIDELEDVLYVPVQSVLLDAGQTIAFVSVNDRPERRDVTVGQSNELWVEIVEGLAEGETVLLSPPADFAPSVVEEGSETSEQEAEGRSGEKGSDKGKRSGSGRPGGPQASADGTPKRSLEGSGKPAGAPGGAGGKPSGKPAGGA